MLRFRIGFHINRNILLHNPSVSFADSSLYTREPLVPTMPMVSALNRNCTILTVPARDAEVSVPYGEIRQLVRYIGIWAQKTRATETVALACFAS